MTWVWNVTAFRGWRCPACQRVMLHFVDRTWAACTGDPNVKQHDWTWCGRVDDREVDPLELARACNLVGSP